MLDCLLRVWVHAIIKAFVGREQLELYNPPLMTSKTASLFLTRHRIISQLLIPPQHRYLLAQTRAFSHRTHTPLPYTSLPRNITAIAAHRSISSTMVSPLHTPLSFCPDTPILRGEGRRRPAACGASSAARHECSQSMYRRYPATAWLTSTPS